LKSKRDPNPKSESKSVKRNSETKAKVESQTDHMKRGTERESRPKARIEVESTKLNSKVESNQSQSNLQKENPKVE
jgi:hypothetical protein